MLRRLGTHVRNQWMGALALFLVLTGGTAYALDGTNTVFSDDIVNGEVKTADLAANAVNSTKVANNSLTLADINKPPWQVVAPNPQTSNDPCDFSTSATFCGYTSSYFVRAFWANFGGDFQTARFYRDAVGQVHIQGLVKAQLGTCGGPSPQCFAPPAIFLLPLGYRPAKDLIFGVDCSEDHDNNPASGVEHGRLDIIANTGEVRWSPGSAFDTGFDNCDPNNYISLSGIEFRAEQ